MGISKPGQSPLQLQNLAKTNRVRREPVPVLKPRVMRATGYAYASAFQL